VRHVHRVLRRLAAEGTSILLTSHRMDELAALCGEVTLLAAGRVVFSGPVGKLAAESGVLDYRLRTSDPVAARRLAAAAADLRVLPGEDLLAREDDGALLVRGAVPAVDALVGRLVAGGVAVRELAPVVPPLEAAFLALTGAGDGREAG
jgi:ABC-2 type transport system ATP-binding protein